MRNRALPAAATLVVALAGCGGGDDDEGASESAQAIPRAEWIARADEICQATDKRVGQLDQASTVEDVARLATDVQALVADELEQLRELPPPADIGEEVEEMLSLQEDEVESFDEVETAAGTGDQEHLESVLEESRRPAEEANRIAGRLGMEECEEPYG